MQTPMPLAGHTLTHVCLGVFALRMSLKARRGERRFAPLHTAPAGLGAGGEAAGKIQGVGRVAGTGLPAFLDTSWRGQVIAWGWGRPLPQTTHRDAQPTPPPRVPPNCLPRCAKVVDLLPIPMHVDSAEMCPVGTVCIDYCAHTHIRACVCDIFCICTHARMCVYINIYIYTYVREMYCVYTHSRVCVYVYIYIHICMVYIKNK